MSFRHPSRRRRPRILDLLAAAFFASLLPPGVQAQAILNTERFQLEEVHGFHLGADLSVAGQRGNTELLDLSSSGIVGLREGRHWTRVIFGGRYLSGADGAILDTRWAQLRYSHVLGPETRTFHFVQAQRNETLLLRSRWLLGSGVRRTFVRGERLRLALGTGVMGEWERLDADRLGPEEPAETDAIRLANMAVVSWDFEGGARLLNILYLQPDLRRPSDLRILNDLGLAVPLTDRVRTTMTLEWRRDTRPPAALERDDVVVRMGLGIDLR
jgi:hypothetical protein